MKNFLAVFLISDLCSLLCLNAAPPPLPTGNNGIAAAYPGDVNIQSNPNVLFADGFDSYTSPSQLTGSGNYSNFFQGSNIALDTSVFSGGTKSLRIRMPASGSEVSNAVVKPISPTRDALFMRVYARYAPNYAGINSAHNSIRMSGKYTGPGRRPNGTDFFLVDIENSRSGSDPEPGYTHAYVYHPEQDDVYGEHWFPDGSTANGSQSFGPDFIARPKVNPARGVWICFEIMVQMNTPGSRDGRVAVWQDGGLVADWQSVRFRDVTTLKIDEIQLENGGQGSTQQNDKWYDSLVIATSYIGPVSTGSGTSACDVNRDAATNVNDVQLCANQAIGVSACTADINKDGACNVIDVQRVVNAALGGQCVTQ